MSAILTASDPKQTLTTSLSIEPKTMQLPVIGILREAFQNISSRRSRLIRSIALPALAISFLSIYIWSSSDPTEEPASLIIVIFLELLSGVYYAFLAVSCHRVFLDDADEPTMIEGISLGHRQLRYIFKAIVVLIPFAVSLVLFAILMVFGFMYIESVAMSELEQTAMAWAVLIPIQYFSSRISLILPAAALNKNLSIASAWELSRGNGWRMTAVILFAPIATDVIWFLFLGGLPSESIAALALDIVISLFAGVVAVGVLSYSYKHLSGKSNLNIAAHVDAIS